MDKDPANHNLCKACWKSLEGERIPHRILEAELDACCRCGKDCADGIFIRAKAEYMPFCPMNTGDTSREFWGKRRARKLGLVVPRRWATTPEEK